MHEYANYYAKHLKQKRAEIDTDTRRVIFGEQAFEYRDNKVYLLTMLLLFSALMLVIFFGKYLGIFSPSVVTWLFILVFATFSYILIKKYYYKQANWLIDTVLGRNKQKERKCKVYHDDEADGTDGTDGADDGTGTAAGADGFEENSSMNLFIV